MEGKSKDYDEDIVQLRATNANLENMLSEKISELEGIFYNSIDPYVVMDIMGNVRRMNTAAKDLLGYDNTNEDFNLVNLVHPDYMEYTQKSFEKLYRDGKLANYKALLFNKNKDIIYVQVNSSLIYNKEGVPVAAQGVIRDITKESKIKQLLEEKSRQLDLIIENSPLGILLTNENNIIKANKSSIALLGYNELELKQMTLENISTIYKNESDSLETYLDESGESGNSLIKEYIKKDGSSFLAKTSISSAVKGEGDKAYRVAIIEDITEQKKLEEQKEQLLKELEKSNIKLEEYAHIVSHDLKSPLQSISALASWLKTDYSKVLDEVGIYQLNAMEEKANTMDKLINGILKYSTVKNDGLEMTMVDTNSIVKDISDIIFIPQNVKVVTNQTLPIIYADKTRIHQLFQNIISNAVTHIENENGFVEITGKETKEYWEFSIKDNGIGIPEEYHKQIFEMFKSVDAEKKSTGIGLSIVKSIVNKHYGHVWLESEVGKGTTFYFTIKKLKDIEEIKNRRDEN